VQGVMFIGMTTGGEVGFFARRTDKQTALFSTALQLPFFPHSLSPLFFSRRPREVFTFLFSAETCSIAQALLAGTAAADGWKREGCLPLFFFKYKLERKLPLFLLFFFSFFFFQPAEKEILR
jgi:hypothetical protein